MLSHLNPIQKNPGRVVVLGANGFIARHLRDWFGSNGIECLAIGSSAIDLSEVDNAPRLAALLRPGDAVVMTSTLTPEKGRDYRTLMRNLRMAETVCRALAETPCAHFVYLSSDAVYDAQKVPLDEDSTREPTDLYALCHTSREMMFGAELAALAIPYCILRLTTVYGPGDTHNAYGPNRFVRTALSDGCIVLFGKGEERRSHIFIDDAIRLIGLALAHRSTGTLNIAIRPAASFGTIAKVIISLAGKPVRVEQAPRTVPVIHRPYKPTQVFRFIYNLGRPIGQVVHRTFVNSAVFAAFPEFSFTPLEKGLARFIDAERDKATSTTPARIDGH
jgi:nucleoside-diphosphate-sugar epimerase